MHRYSSLILTIGIITFILFIKFVDIGDWKLTVTAGVTILMAVLWISEALPLAITALIPLIIFPLTGVLSASKISEAYINSIIFLFIGGFLIAIAIESWGLHKRMALKIILFFGSKPNRILIGFMIASAFISMWISNTATVLMMLPVAFAVITNLSESSEISPNFTKAILLGIAYSCSIGGIATLVGTQPNLVFVRTAKIIFPQSPQVSFIDWMLMALPISVIILICAYFLINFLFKISSTITNSNDVNEKNILLNEYKKLGPVSFEEKAVSIVFITTVLLWLTRVDIDLGFMKFSGWANLLNLVSFVDDSTVVILTSLILFIIPAKNKSVSNRILTISALEKIPWGVVLLFGGGFALAEAFVESGLSVLISSNLKIFSSLNIILLIFIVAIMINFLTELTSNTAISQIFLPIVASLAVSLNYHPFLLMIPATLASSMAFMLPVGTPPNTIIFSSNKLKIIDLIKTGFLLNLISTILITLIFYYISNFIFKLDIFPSWGK